MSERERLGELRTVIRSGDVALFTGAGFSAEARDCEGRSLPDARRMVSDLWRMLYGSAPVDDSTLSDLYDVALLQARDELRQYMSTRLRIGHQPLPQSFQRWFSAPWRRIYTLNVDDLEVAVARQYELPRPLVSVSALAPRGERSGDLGALSEASGTAEPRAGLEIVHLNGIAGDDPEDVTFSTMQYAARLCAPDREYERLVHDLATRPFVFVGTTLDEVVLWKHVQLERQANGHRSPRRHSFLISPSLTRARQSLLASYRIQWIPATAAQIAEQLL
jgi:hypothetical protein